MSAIATKKALTLAGAKQIAAAAVAEAVNNQWNMAVCVVDDGGHMLYFERPEGAQVGSVQVAQEKAITSVRFKRPTKVLEDAIAAGRSVLLTLPGATPIEGGLPIVAGGEVVGAIGVSGGTSLQDGQVAAAGLVALEKMI